MAKKEDPKKDIAPEKKAEKKATYSAENITVLEGLEPVRKRPGMYIGSTSETGLHHLIWEVVDNSVDEAMAGHADRIEVILQKDGGVKVTDNGRGIPVDTVKATKKSALETVLTVLHAGGKFGGEASGYKVSGGLHGVGVSVVNALSTDLTAQVRRDGKVYEQKFKIGKSQGAVKVVGKIEKNDPMQTGTAILFYPDKTVFETTEFKFKTVIEHLRSQAYLTKGLHFIISDEHSNLTYQYYFEGGILSYIKQVNRNRKARHVPIYINKMFEGDIMVEVAIQYTDDYDETVLAYANNEYNPEGGMHVTGFRTALTRIINNYAVKSNYVKESEKLTGEDLREGLTAVISVKLPNPQFEGQTKAKLGNPEVRTAVEGVVSQELEIYLNEHPQESSKIIEKAILAAKARMAARAARDSVIRKGVLDGLALPGKLADCSESDPTQCELYIVEGDSAGGCFSGDTKIALADGRHLTFLELIAEQEAGIQNFCYTIRRNGTIGLEEIKNIRQTKQNAEVIKVTLDNGEAITCTPDHKFMLRNGSYKAAVELATTDSLMPLYRKVSDVKTPGITIDGYEMVWNPKSDSWLFTHKLADWHNRWRKVYAKQATEAVQNYNHKIVKIERLQERINVYDLEIPITHNFALASGVFVHNSAKQGRDRRFQAILPLRGKILNVERARLDKMLTSQEIKNLVIAFGTGVGELFDIGKLRYHRIIIMTDADVDGAHIRTLLLTLFYRYFPDIIRNGHLYIAQPPLYRIQIGKEFQYAFSDDERNEIKDDMTKEALAKKAKSGKEKTSKKGAVAEIDENDGAIEESATGDAETENDSVSASVETVAGVKVNIQRYKGLGEMNPDQLWETTMDPENRVMLKVEIEDAEKISEVFETLMGDEVPPRKRFITTHAKLVKNLDI